MDDASLATEPVLQSPPARPPRRVCPDGSLPWTAAESWVANRPVAPLMNTQPPLGSSTFYAGAVLASFGMVGAGVFILFALIDLWAWEGGGFAILLIAPLASCAVAAIVQAAIFYAMLRKHDMRLPEAWWPLFSSWFVGCGLGWIFFIALMSRPIVVSEAVGWTLMLGIGATLMLGIFVLGTLLMSSSIPTQESR